MRDGTVYDLLMAVRSRQRTPYQTLTEQEEMKKQVTGLVVVTRYNIAIPVLPLLNRV